jgi:uncharacterized protein (DUF924 family)
MTNTATPQALLDFWFEDALDQPAKLGQRMKVWFGGGPKVDAEIQERFGATVEALGSGLGETWAAQGPRERLAAIIGLDQFSRSIHRKSPKAFANDPLALRLAKEGIASGEDRQLPLAARMFIYLPLEHSETMDDQRESIRLFEVLASEADDANREMFASTLDYAHRHADVIAKFGRFPHRNDVLGRASTPEEIAWVKEHGGF